MQVVATVTANSTEERDTLIAQILDDAESVRNEDGCRSYEVFTSGSRRIVFIEDWAGPEALGVHAKSPQFQAFIAQLEALNIGQSLQVFPLSPAS